MKWSSIEHFIELVTIKISSMLKAIASGVNFVDGKDNISNLAAEMMVLRISLLIPSSPS